jgi:CDP-glucose 4,6-dehydratase
LEPLSGYLQVGAGLSDSAIRTSWNFGPGSEAARPVAELVDALIKEWGSGHWESDSVSAGPYEADYLMLSTEKAREQLAWTPAWTFESAVSAVASWYSRVEREGEPPEDVMSQRISEYQTSARTARLAWTR